VIVDLQEENPNSASVASVCRALDKLYVSVGGARQSSLRVSKEQENEAVMALVRYLALESQAVVVQLDLQSESTSGAYVLPGSYRNMGLFIKNELNPCIATTIVVLTGAELAEAFLQAQLTLITSQG
jgi:hypothetical protein